MVAAGWYRDPVGYGEGRYWDGQRWTDSVTRDGYTNTSPMDPARAEIPPAPGSELNAARPPAAPPAQQVTVSSGGGGTSTPTAAILGGIAVLVAVVAIIIALANSGSDDDDTPTTTEAPATTAPELDEGGE